MPHPQSTTEKRKSHRTTLTMKPELWEQILQISEAKGLEPLDTLRWLLSDGVANYQHQRQARGESANGTKPTGRGAPKGGNPQARDGPQQLL